MFFNQSNTSKPEDPYSDGYAISEEGKNLIARWDGFLEKIKSRFHESLDHAQDACMTQMVETDYDYDTVYRA